MSRCQQSLLIILILLVSGCGSSENHKLESLSSDVIAIDKNDFVDHVIESEVFDSVSFIPMHLSGNELIGTISDIQLYRSNYYVLDLTTAKIH